jgi:hypothetical protein
VQTALLAYLLSSEEDLLAHLGGDPGGDPAARDGRRRLGAEGAALI